MEENKREKMSYYHRYWYFKVDIEQTNVKIGPITSVLSYVLLCPCFELDDLLPEPHLFLEALNASESTRECSFEADSEVFPIFIQEMNYFFAESPNKLKKLIRDINIA